MADAKAPRGKRRRTRASKPPTTPDPVEIAMEAEASGGQPKGFAHEVLRRQAILLASDLKLRGWEIADRRMAYALKVLTAAAGITAAIALGLMIWSASRANGLVIETFSVPPALAERGITGEVVARRLMDDLTAISEVSRSTEQQRGLSGDWGKSISIQVPQTGVSLAQLNAWLCAALGHQSYVGGEVTSAPDGTLTVSARSGSHRLETLTGQEAELALLIQRTAEAVYAREQRWSFPIYLTRQDRWDEIAASSQSRLSSPDDRERATAHFWLGVVAQRTEGDLAHVARLRKSLSADPTYPGAVNQLSQFEDRVGHPEAALRLRQRHLAFIAADSVGSAEYKRQQTAISRRLIAQWRGDWIEARSQAQANRGKVLLGGAAFNNQTPLLMAGIDASLHDLDQAQADLSGFEPTTPDDQRSLRTTTLEMLIRAEDWPRVVKAADAVLADQEGLPDKGVYRPVPRAQKAAAMAHLGQIAEAQMLVDATPLDCQPCVITRGEIAALAGRPQLADHWFREAVKLAPSLPMASVAWGRSLLDRGQPEGAISQFEIAHARSPHFADPLSRWGEALLRKGEMKAAIKMFREADKYAPKWGRNHLLWGEALAKMGKTDKAREQWRAAAGMHLSTADLARVSQLLARPT